jgi:RNA polymerase sigma-70 factor (ECF subfamily)
MISSQDYSGQVRELANRLAETGIDALGALFDFTSQRLVRFAVAVTRNQHDAEDAVQAALVRLGREPALLSATEKPWAYLLQIVRNESLVIVRRKARVVLPGSLVDLATNRCVDQLEQEDTHRAVWLALRSLPTAQAEVVVLKIWEAMTFAEIGEILAISPNTAASRYQYAMGKLSQRLMPLREAHHG